ncbi:hypothetical protein VU04_09300 [Desulfobulbus sp. TB]|nr:hypothetical protein [Desulfobulbus sp. TB]
MNSKDRPSVGLVELPSFKLFSSDKTGDPLLSPIDGHPLISKQILLSSLRGSGFDAELINLKEGDYQEEYGTVTWQNRVYSKAYRGSRIQDVDPSTYGAWGVTNNFLQQREIACMTIRHLSSRGRPVVVGGSDAVADPQVYLAAGAAAVVLDKSGAVNAPIMDYVLGRTARETLSGVLLANGVQPPRRVHRTLHPEDWPIPEKSVIEQCLGTNIRNLPLSEERLKVGSVITDMGCDRRCDFCQTPTYKIGYRAMSPGRVLQWLTAQKQAGAKSVLGYSDQFLGRILKKGGREEILDIMQGLKELGLAVLWDNGLELQKATLGRSIVRNGRTDMTPDEELIKALWGWDGRTGCYEAYIPAERPIFGGENYAKLLPWKEHSRIMRCIVQAGVPYIRYGVIIGFEDDSDDTLRQLEEAVSELYTDITAYNSSVNFQVTPMTLLPIPGTKQWDTVRNSGLLRNDDTSLLGGLGTPVLDTRYLNYEQVQEWQIRLAKIGTPAQS